MKYKCKEDITCRYRVIDLISQDELDRLNNVFHTAYRKASNARVNKIKRKDLTFEEYRRLMQTTPGFGRREQYQTEV